MSLKNIGLKKPYLKFLGLPNPDLNFGHITKPGPAKRGDPFIFSPIFLTLSIQSSIINTLCNEQFSKLGSVFFSKVIPRPFKFHLGSDQIKNTPYNRVLKKVSENQSHHT